MKFILTANYLDRNSENRWLVRKDSDGAEQAVPSMTVCAKGVTFGKPTEVELAHGCDIVAFCDEIVDYPDNLPDGTTVLSLDYFRGGFIAQDDNRKVLGCSTLYCLDDGSTLCLDPNKEEVAATTDESEEQLAAGDPDDGDSDDDYLGDDDSLGDNPFGDPHIYRERDNEAERISAASEDFGFGERHHQPSADRGAGRTPPGIDELMASLLLSSIVGKLGRKSPFGRSPFGGPTDIGEIDELKELFGDDSPFGGMRPIGAIRGSDLPAFLASLGSPSTRGMMGGRRAGPADVMNLVEQIVPQIVPQIAKQLEEHFNQQLAESAKPNGNGKSRFNPFRRRKQEPTKVVQLNLPDSIEINVNIRG